MKYRLAEEKDIGLLAEWNHQLIQDEGHRNQMTVVQIEERMRGFLAGEYTAIIFEVESDPVGYALYREEHRDIYLRQFFIRRDHRREGLGRQAMMILRDKIWPRDRRLTLEVLTVNESGIAFWRSVGYREYCLTMEILPESR